MAPRGRRGPRNDNSEEGGEHPRRWCEKKQGDLLNQASPECMVERKGAEYELFKSQRTHAILQNLMSTADLGDHYMRDHGSLLRRVAGFFSRCDA